MSRRSFAILEPKPDGSLESCRSLPSLIYRMLSRKRFTILEHKPDASVDDDLLHMIHVAGSRFWKVVASLVVRREVMPEVRVRRSYIQ